MARGSCLCGGIGFEIDDAAVVLAVACYCTKCRKVSGSQFGIYLQVKRSGFRWLAGEDRVGSYESSPGNRRASAPRAVPSRRSRPATALCACRVARSTTIRARCPTS